MTPTLTAGKPKNGWPVLTRDEVVKWLIPGTGRHLVLPPGPVGLVLVHLALWFHEKVERLELGVWDEWGWASRNIRDSDEISLHAKGKAIDLNAVRHPLGVPAGQTFTAKQIRAIRRRLKWMNRLGLVVSWGGEWRRPDGMHFEIPDAVPLRRVQLLARVLEKTPRGRRVIKANPKVRW